MTTKCTSNSGSNIGLAYTGGKVFMHVDPRPTKGDTGMTLGLFCEMFGIPVKLIYDVAP